jgi:hypothetical protein
VASLTTFESGEVGGVLKIDALPHDPAAAG